MKTFKIYYTSDTHGHLLPIDYATNQPKNTGLLACGHDYKKDGNTLIIDGGDTIQGSPFTMYSHRLKTDIHPVATALNAAGYDYVTLGNHDFNYGEDHLKKYLDDLDAQCLCANVHGNLPLAPSTIKVLENGLRLGIIGAVTDWVNIWEKPEHLTNLKITDPFEAVQNQLEILKNQTDMTLCIYHGGFENDIHSGEKLSDSTENIAYQIAEKLDFDLLLTGHQHIPIEGHTINGTYVVQPAHNATHYLEINYDGQNFTSNFKTPTHQYDSNGLEAVEAIEKDVQNWLDAPVGFLDRPLIPAEKVEMALNGTPLADFFNQVQLEATGADISVTSLANQVKGFDQQVTVRDVVSTYVYPNTIIVLKINGSQLKTVLERTSQYLDITPQGPQVSNSFLKPKIEHYNYDYFANVTFTADLKKPAGQRVSHIKFKGQDVQDSDTFTICMNNYRSTGAGGYDIYKDCPVVKEYQIEMSELIINYFEKHKQVSVTPFEAPNFSY